MTHQDPPVSALFRHIYAFFYNKLFGLIIILAMAIATLLGTILMQAPDSVVSDPAMYAQWLKSVRPRYGGWTDALSFLGMFHVFGSWWFQTIAVLLALSIIACTTHRLPSLIEASYKPHTHVSDAFFDKARYRERIELKLSPSAALEQTRAALGGHRYRVLEDASSSDSMYADRFRWAPFGTAVAHLGFVVILAGVLVSSMMGFRDTNMPVTVGYRATVGHDTNLVVEAKSFTDSYYADGRPSDYASHLVLYRDGVQVAEQEVRVNEPLRYDNVTFYQSFFGISAVVKVQDASGTVIFEGGVPLSSESDSGQESIGRFQLPGSQMVVYVVTAASGQVKSSIKPGEVEIDVYESDAATKPLGIKKVTQGNATVIGDLTYTFVREAPYTGLQVARDPGALWVWIGSFLTVVGMTVTMALKHRRIWVRATPTDTGCRLSFASPERNDSVFERWFHQMVAEIESGAATKKEGTPHG